jgi:hypothetical protein
MSRYFFKKFFVRLGTRYGGAPIEEESVYYTKYFKVSSLFKNFDLQTLILNFEVDGWNEGFLQNVEKMMPLNLHMLMVGYYTFSLK